MSDDTAPTKITRLEELPRDIPLPRDGWPALEARLRESGALPTGAKAAGEDRGGAVEARPADGRPIARRWGARRSTVWFGAVAAAVAAVAAGILVDRVILQAGRVGTGGPLTAHQASAQSHAGERGAEIPASFINDPRYLAERRALLDSLDERLKSLPPQTRQQVLASLATIHQSMQQIQQALGREPTNALLQGLLIDTYQDEMRVLTAVQEAGTGSGES